MMLIMISSPFLMVLYWEFFTISRQPYFWTQSPQPLISLPAACIHLQLGSSKAARWPRKITLLSSPDSTFRQLATWLEAHSPWDPAQPLRHSPSPSPATGCCAQGSMPGPPIWASVFSPLGLTLLPSFFFLSSVWSHSLLKGLIKPLADDPSHWFAGHVPLWVLIPSPTPLLLSLFGSVKVTFILSHFLFPSPVPGPTPATLDQNCRR